VSRNTQKLGGVVLLAGFGHGLASTWAQPVSTAA
jgi:hypothetical protein